MSINFNSVTAELGRTDRRYLSHKPLSNDYTGFCGDCNKVVGLEWEEGDGIAVVACENGHVLEELSIDRFAANERN